MGSTSGKFVFRMFECCTDSYSLLSVELDPQENAGKVVLKNKSLRRRKLEGYGPLSSQANCTSVTPLVSSLLQVCAGTEKTVVTILISNITTVRRGSSH